MRKFAAFIAKLLIIIVLSAVVLDVLYTAVYLKASKRNKIEYVIDSKDKNFDVIFMGSSRTQNHIVAKLFNDKGIKAFNFGMNGSKLEETSLLLKLMVERNYKIKNLFLDVDVNLNSNSHSKGVRAMYMPYLLFSQTIRNHYKSIDEYNKLAYIPFYRYIENDAKIGFREMFFSLAHNKTKALKNFGYVALKKYGGKLSYDMSSYSPKRNIAYEEIKAICKKNNINLIAISSPMCQECQSDLYFNSIKLVYPEVYNYENKVTDDKYFSTCGHMNFDGASLFTTIILNDFIQHKFNN